MPSLAWTTALITLAAIALYSDNLVDTPTRETRSPNRLRSITCPNTAVGITANYDAWCKANCAMGFCPVDYCKCPTAGATTSTTATASSATTTTSTVKPTTTASSTTTVTTSAVTTTAITSTASGVCTAWKGTTATYDVWCQANCAQGFCPADLCSCRTSGAGIVTTSSTSTSSSSVATVATSPSKTTSTTTTSSSSAPSTTTTTSSIPTICTAWKSVAKTSAMDTWCSTNCAAGYCPVDLCACAVSTTTTSTGSSTSTKSTTTTTTKIVPVNTAVPDLSTYKTLMSGFAFVADTYLTPLTYTNATTDKSGCDADSCVNGTFAAVRQVTWSDGVSNKICLCTKPVVSWADTVARFSRVPTSIRKDVIGITIASNVDGYGGLGEGAWTSADYSTYQGTTNMVTNVFIHESSHAWDGHIGPDNQTARSSSVEWLSALNADSCVADDYSASSQHEAFAQTVVYYLYLQATNALHGNTSECMRNQLDVVERYLPLSDLKLKK